MSESVRANQKRGARAAGGGARAPRPLLCFGAPDSRSHWLMKISPTISRSEKCPNTFLFGIWRGIDCRIRDSLYTKNSILRRVFVEGDEGKVFQSGFLSFFEAYTWRGSCPLASVTWSDEHLFGVRVCSATTYPRKRKREGGREGAGNVRQKATAADLQPPHSNTHMSFERNFVTRTFSFPSLKFLFKYTNGLPQENSKARKIVQPAVFYLCA